MDDSKKRTITEETLKRTVEKMNKRNAPQAQYEQLEKIRERWEKLKIV